MGGPDIRGAKPRLASRQARLRRRDGVIAAAREFLVISRGKWDKDKSPQEILNLYDFKIHGAAD